MNAQVAEWFGEAPANSKACAADRGQELLRRPSTPPTRPTATRSAYWTTPIAQCLDGRTDVKCKDYAEWTQAWTEIKG